MLADQRTEIDKMLVRLVAAGDEEAFEKLYQRFGDILYSTVCKILGDKKEAEDVLQEVLAELWRTAGRYDSAKGSPFSWAITVTRSRAIDRFRSRRRKDWLVSEQGETGYYDREVDVRAEDDLVLREKRETIVQAMSGLPPEEREAVELSFFTGLSHPEIADQLRSPLGTVKARIRRGLLRLRDYLKEGL